MDFIAGKGMLSNSKFKNEVQVQIALSHRLFGLRHLTCNFRRNTHVE